MSQLIRYPAQASTPLIDNDIWKVVRTHQSDQEVVLLPHERHIVPFSWWLIHGDSVLSSTHKTNIGLWFAPDDNLLLYEQKIKEQLANFSLLAVDFPVFRDGRGMSTAAILRERFAWTGELRAIGDVLVDQLSFMARVGFDSFLLRSDQQVELALQQFTQFRFKLQDDWRGPRSQHSSTSLAKLATAHSSTVPLWQIPRSTPGTLPTKVETLQKRLTQILVQHDKVVFATSLVVEDMVLTDMLMVVLANHADFAQLDWVTLDTGRLPPETLSILQITEQRYGIKVRVLHPDDEKVQSYKHKYGLNGFYNSEAAKQECCQIRKVVPLQNTLKDCDAWISGQRRGQSSTRHTIDFQEVDTNNGISKYNPIFDWSEAEIWAYTLERRLPIHPLHKQGFPSIGCAPCTRAIFADENIRSGRWWWLQKEHKECGLHLPRTTNTI